MAAPVAPAAAGPPTWLDRARVDGSGLVCPVAVLADRPPGLASGFAHQYRRYLLARWGGRGTAFQKAGRQVECTLLVLWEDGYKDPWLILTDLPPEASDAAWYGL